MMNAVLFDLDGVLYEGESMLPGAAQTVAWFAQRAIPHLFVTNTTSRSRPALVQKLLNMGIQVAEEEIMTPPVAARRWLEQRDKGPVALFLPEATRTEFAGLPQVPAGAEHGAAAVVLGDLGADWSFATLNRAFRLLMDEPTPTLIALGMTRYWRAPDGLRLDTGPFVRALEYATGVTSVVLGKPAPPFFESALSMLGAEAAATVMVGDDVRGDIEAAQQAGLHGVLVKTGKFRPSDLRVGVSPAAVIDSIARLPEWWQQVSSGSSD